MKALFFVCQLAGLWGLNELGYFITEQLHLPFPGNVMGLLLLFVLLVSGVIKLTWIEDAASFLIRHLAFFFIPVAVGLMKVGGILVMNGVAIMTSLIVSAIVGLLITSGLSQLLERRKERTNEHIRDTI
ncbi:holin-like protein [Aneurinibacillus soli]|uniref:Holin-like protein CidA n=1 Tax=Aneurinibacillus soli TaxID=1500254 RepID=A0A0U4NH39_9BACL|nr:CidA/LrgA family protein [Aneurinibacillus soli]PYE64103.1 holin-like protein [Aneurinibacillus soli]BAU28052.1 Holin-like protein CidA [Aneurinibacillus soli]